MSAGDANLGAPVLDTVTSGGGSGASGAGDSYGAPQVCSSSLANVAHSSNTASQLPASYTCEDGSRPWEIRFLMGRFKTSVISSVGQPQF